MNFFKNTNDFFVDNPFLIIIFILFFSVVPAMAYFADSHPDVKDSDNCSTSSQIYFEKEYKTIYCKDGSVTVNGVQVLKGEIK